MSFRRMAGRASISLYPFRDGIRHVALAHDHQQGNGGKVEGSITTVAYYVVSERG
ncbi:hypothetical protein Abin_028_001 [Acetobacter indonesiensis]|uniref:Uncharacterized protein n=1 Tax=Acetobacter indonesiensis TaxID=104101 RepID=A0ABQ0K926_9PROT|nr:hypothetical protein Abin_028_001 [Acetobacter indonesiensis]